MLLLLRGAEVFSPAPLGVRDVLVVQDKVARVEPSISPSELERAGLPLEVVDLSGHLLWPGLIDPHAHLVGTGGEQGFASRTGDVPYEDLVNAGITTVVGCLGTDDDLRGLACLLGRVRQLQRQGISALMYTGSFHFPPPHLTGSVRSDLIILPEVVGVGEVAISDFRSTEPSKEELARMASDALVGGLLGEKAGVVHLHVGESPRHLSLLHQVLDDFDVPARHLYPTHIMRSDGLLDDGIELAKKGSFIDFDCIQPLPQWVKKYLDRGGDPSRLTFSSDAHAPEGFPHKLWGETLRCMRENGRPKEEILRFVTENVACALKLPSKGRVRVGGDADLLAVKASSLELRHVISRGRRLMRDGSVPEPRKESFTEK